MPWLTSKLSNDAYRVIRLRFVRISKGVAMSDLTIFPADIAEMSVSQLAALLPEQKREVDKNLDEERVKLWVPAPRLVTDANKADAICLPAIRYTSLPQLQQRLTAEPGMMRPYAVSAAFLSPKCSGWMNSRCASPCFSVI